MERTPQQNEQKSARIGSETASEGGVSMAPPAFGLTAEPAQLQENPHNTIQRQDDSGDGGAADEGNWWDGIVEMIRGWFGSDPTGDVDDTDTPAVVPDTDGPVQDGPVQDNDNQVATTTVTLEASVGDGGANMPSDVREVQDRLHELTYLSDADFGAEQVDAGGTDPIPTASLTRTIVAIARFSSATVGRPLMLIQPNNITSTQINAEPPQALGGLAVGGTVGRGATNNAADVRVVQARLHTLTYLSDANFAAEQVGVGVQGVIADANLVETIAAIHAFNLAVTGTSLHIVRPDSLEQETLNNPPRFTTSIFSLGGSVGTGGANAHADVVAIQTRLATLGYLSAANQLAETPAAPVAGQEAQAVAEAALAQTIAAINGLQGSMGLTQNGQVVPGNETHRQMMNPSLSSQTDVNIAQSVGDGGVNANADVRLIQDRLQNVGFLTTAHYLAERVDGATAGNVALGTIPNTMIALRSFQTKATGGSDGRIDPNGRTERILNNPTHGTMTDVNAESTNPEAAVEFQNADAALTRIITAIEAGEGGGLQGEAPAYLTNGAGTPASFGSAQMIGGTAVGTLQNNDDVAAEYGLSDQDLTEMADLARNATTHYNDIYALVPMGRTQAQINAGIAQYRNDHGETFNATTGLGLEDIDRMFHTANIRRRIIAGQGWTNADLRASADFVGMNQSSVATYQRNTASLGENRAAFATKAAMSHEEGQGLRNAMSDDNGQTIGRLLIRDNFGAAGRAVAANDANRARNIAAVTAIMHNRGGGAARWYGQINTVLADPYVQHFLGRW
jgi:hypothetical protein